MKTVLITGATSFIGFALCSHMIDLGCDVHVVVRPSTDLSRFNTLKVKPIIHQDQGTMDCFRNALAACNPDVVYHLATRYLREHTADDIGPMIESNILFGTRLLEAMCEAKVANLIYAGTYAQHYGDDEVMALNLNAATKEAFRTIVDYYVDAKGIFASQLTLFDVYGPGDWRFRLVNAICESQKTGAHLALPTEDFPLDLIYVDDAVSAFVQAGQQILATPESISSKEFAVSSGKHFRLSEIIDIFEKVEGTKVIRDWGKFPIPERAPRRLWTGDPVPGWQPEVSLEEGISRLIKAEEPN